ncbi:MAG: leucine--tRNA ligase [Bacteroidetes bacterium]|nr:leucine--tRNA ligase [Bacteroidota bacterium]
MADIYDHRGLEKKWQDFWEKEGIYRTENLSKKPKQYILDMFPYPSGAGLHVGHPRGYIGSDVLSRMRRMQGFNVLHPMGFDAFGLPAEQYAIQTGEHPSIITEKAIETYKKQLELIGLSYDWSREVRTIDPQYYKWTQWIFLKLFESFYDEEEKKAKPISELVKRFEKEDSSWSTKSEKEKQDVLMNYRLAYEGLSEVNWCEELGTVLANDEIIDGPNGEPVSERGGFPVIKKEMKQMFLRITSYADRLLSGLETIDWPEHIKEIQRNWIGKSEGAEIEFAVKGSDEKIKVFTTRPDTLFGVTYLAVPGTENKFTGKYAINPANGEEVPIWEADYVLEGYGTGAVMGVPAHDERDFEFAKKFGLPIKEVLSVNLNSKDLLNPPKIATGTYKNFKPANLRYDFWSGEGELINSGEFSGMSSEKAKQKITEFVDGKFVTKYKMRDAVFARQRYWGEPIPLRREDGIIHPLKEDELPLELPQVDSYKPSGTGESPLASVSEWVSKGYETNTMPGWAGSSWYFLRYMDPKNSEAFAGKDALHYWQNVDVYIGGAEHATGHLLYARFWNKFLHDLGYLPTDEPFKLLKNQGLILASDGRKMSKRWGNVVNPDEMVERFGADAFRLYEMFIGPFDQYTSWNTDGLVGTRRFLERVWKLKEKISDIETNPLVHRTIKKVGGSIVDFRFNTCVSDMMILTNEIDTISKEDYLNILKILAPFAPHMTEELWHELGEKGSIHMSDWPKVDESKIGTAKIKIAVQVNGKVRAEIEISPEDTEEFVKKIVFDEISSKIDIKEIKKFIYVKGKIVNIVI